MPSMHLWPSLRQCVVSDNGVEDIDLGWNAILKDLKLMEGSYTKVGIQEGEKYESSDKGSKTKGGADMVVVAAANEFGTETIEERSFLRSSYDENKAVLNTVIEKELDKILKKESNVKKSLGLIGEWMQSKIQRKITTLRDPPNKPSTIKRKGSSNPLIDTGQMRASVRHVEKIGEL